MSDARPGADPGADPSAGRSASPASMAAGAILPGLGHTLSGRRAMGVPIMVGWLLSLVALVGSWPRLVAVPRTGSTDDWIAALTLAALLLGFWIAGTAGLARTRAAGARTDSQVAIAWRRFRRSRIAVAGLAVLFVLYVVTLLTPFLAPYGHAEEVGSNLVLVRLLPPSGEYLLGTDRLGRDMLSRILYGARISLTIGFVATAISVFVGTAIGAVAGYAGGRVDALLMRFTDVVLSIPRLVLLILIVALFGRSITIIILVLGLTQWPTTTRIVRGDVLSIREREYIQAAQALGFSRARILLRHIVPNVMGPVIVAASLGIGNTIVLEAGLSFLGLGPPPPTSTWGTMIEGGRDIMLSSWWVATFPGLAIVIVVLAFNLVGDGLRDALDPRLR
jgi:peptide/nickel transport system permease protein